MSDETLPAAPIIQILSELGQSTDRQIEAVGALGRQVSSIDRQLSGIGASLEGMTKVFGEETAKTDLSIRKLDQSIKILIDEVRSVMKRLGPLELEVAFLKDHRNGSDNG